MEVQGRRGEEKTRTMENQGPVNILVVDDDRETGKQECFDVIISDMKLGPNLTGLDVLRTYKALHPESEVILITAFGTMETAIQSLKAGAFDYLSKPFKIDELLVQVGRAL